LRPPRFISTAFHYAAEQNVRRAALPRAAAIASLPILPDCHAAALCCASRRFSFRHFAADFDCDVTPPLIRHSNAFSTLIYRHY